MVHVIRKTVRDRAIPVLSLEKMDCEVRRRRPAGGQACRDAAAGGPFVRAHGPGWEDAGPIVASAQPMPTNLRSPSGLLAISLLGIFCAGCGHAPPTPPRVYTPVPTKADSLGPAVPPVYVHLVAKQGTVLERSTDDDWADVCVAPCDGYVPAFGTYRVSLPDQGPSSVFTLPGPPGTLVALKVDDDGTVWTRDSVQLASQRAQRAASGATWLALWGLLRR